jgi:hypothetical protein
MVEFVEEGSSIEVIDEAVDRLLREFPPTTADPEVFLGE